MENNDFNSAQNQIQIELSDEIAQGVYANLAVIAHSASDFIFDFILIVPGATKAKVKSRVILSPDNAKKLSYALQDNIRKYEEMTKNEGHFRPFNDLIPPIGGVTGQA